MAKLLPTRLPIASGESVSAETFNRLVRILELNLGSFDVMISIIVFNKFNKKLNKIKFRSKINTILRVLLFLKILNSRMEF